MSDETVHVTELDVRRARLMETLAKRLGKTPPESVTKVARVQLPEGSPSDSMGTSS
ncbi:MAG: hypothetical protein JWN06_1018 [Propionibacteriaceae bacterium]|jgi:hypothetical protein|nr:hypothetical protein [Propionibacteriaceae bacterium]